MRNLTSYEPSKLLLLDDLIHDRSLTIDPELRAQVQQLIPTEVNEYRSFFDILKQDEQSQYKSLRSRGAESATQWEVTQLAWGGDFPDPPDRYKLLLNSQKYHHLGSLTLDYRYERRHGDMEFSAIKQISTLYKDRPHTEAEKEGLSSWPLQKIHWHSDGDYSTLYGGGHRNGMHPINLAFDKLTNTIYGYSGLNANIHWEAQLPARALELRKPNCEIAHSVLVLCYYQETVFALDLLSGDLNWVRRFANNVSNFSSYGHGLLIRQYGEYYYLDSATGEILSVGGRSECQGSTVKRYICPSIVEADGAGATHVQSLLGKEFEINSYDGQQFDVDYFRSYPDHLYIAETGHTGRVLKLWGAVRDRHFEIDGILRKNSVFAPAYSVRDIYGYFVYLYKKHGDEEGRYLGHYDKSGKLVWEARTDCITINNGPDKYRGPWVLMPQCPKNDYRVESVQILDRYSGDLVAEVEFPGQVGMKRITSITFDDFRESLILRFSTYPVSYYEIAPAVDIAQ
jgi:hypothetical protein